MLLDTRKLPTRTFDSAHASGKNRDSSTPQTACRRNGQREKKEEKVETGGACLMSHGVSGLGGVKGKSSG